MKNHVGNIDATPSKQVFKSIIADYDLRTGICELLDNAIDQWVRCGRKGHLRMAVAVDVAQQSIQVEDNAGGIAESDLRLLVTPGAGSNAGTEALIGLFGVGTKRAVVALAEQVQIRTRKGKGKTFQVEYDNQWLEGDDWRLPTYEVQNIPIDSTIVELSKLRFAIEAADLLELKEHLQATYAVFLQQGNVEIEFLENELLTPLLFDKWTYPPGYEPRNFHGSLNTKDGEVVQLRAVGGLANEQGSIAGEYGVYVYCNNRLIARSSKTPEVGFLAGFAGAPHNTISLVRVVVFLSGPADAMPWTSNKAGINANHATFRTLRRWLMNTVREYAEVCRRFHGQWPEQVFKYDTGTIVDTPITDFEHAPKRHMPRLPPKRKSYDVALHEQNRVVLEQKPWTEGAIDADAAVELVRKQNFSQKNRIALIILDSTLEIAYKDYLVNETSTYYSNAQLAKLFESRHQVLTEVKKTITLPKTVWRRLTYYYHLRNKLVHEKATVAISDTDIEKFRKLTHRVLTKLFNLKWAAPA